MNLQEVLASHQKDITATPTEVQKLSHYMLDAREYLEYGSGGTTKLACTLGVQSITSIETSMDFCTQIIDKLGLQDFINTRRLKLRHVSMGKTGAWGWPVDPRSHQIETYLSWPSKVRGFDLGFIDGRYRVAVAAEMAQWAACDATILIHDYTVRSHYHIVEEFLVPVESVHTLMCFKIKKDGSRVAAEIASIYKNDRN